MKPDYAAGLTRITGEPIHGAEKIRNLIQYHRDIIAIHKTETALMRGSLKYLHGGLR